MLPPTISYFVLVPELGTDRVVGALRNSWLRGLPAQNVHYCVAGNTASRDTLLHRLELTRRRHTPIAREAFFAGGRLIDRVGRERYNGFLRRKVLAVLQAMSDLAARGALDYAVLLDADTAINVTNFESFARALPGSGDVPIFTGRCLQDPLAPGDSSSSGGAAAQAPKPTHRRRDVAWYIEARRRNGPKTPWPGTIPPSPGGGPGILFSRALLTTLRSNLSSCEPLGGWMGMGDSIFSGGDSMITRCLASLGVRCSNEHDLRLDEPGRCPFAHGCELTALFRKNPPWFYIAARRHQNRARHGAQRTSITDVVYGLVTPLHETISFHHVKPSNRSLGMQADVRCAVRMRSDPAGRAGWWGSACLPHFALVGTPHAGADSLLHAIFEHPEVVAPPFEKLDFFSLPGRAQQLIREVGFQGSPALRHLHSMGGVASGRRGSSSSSKWRTLLKLYANHFPSIDPRDFRLTGESSPGYFYSAVAATFFSHELLRLVKLVVVLREPATRALADLVGVAHRRRNAVSGGVNLLRQTTEHVLGAAHSLQRRCGIDSLYAALGTRATRASMPTSMRDAHEQCVSEVSQMHAVGSDAWTALGRSWYHLFLQSWLELANGNRPLVLFWEDLALPATAKDALHKLTKFLQLQQPAALDATQLIGDGGLLSGHESKGDSFNVSATGANALRALTADAATRTDALLRLAGHRGVPSEWNIAKRSAS